MQVALDVQHMFKKSAPNDRGASYGNFVESYITAQYAMLAKIALEVKGHQVYISDKTSGILVGDYWERKKWANNSGIDLYVACHVNAGGGAYGLVEITSEVKESATVAEKCSELITTHLKHTNETKIWTLKKEDRGFVCISTLTMPSILYEPYFIDNIKSHRSAELVAKVLVDLVIWYDNKLGMIE